MARKIVITSGKGGVGKTTLAACLCMQLARRGQKVVLCDADFGLNNVDVALGVEKRVVYDVVDIMQGRCRAKQALVRHHRIPNLHILTSSHSAPERYVSPQALKVVLDNLSPQFDFIIIDSPAGIDEGFHRAVVSANEAIVVVTPQISSLRDADKVVTLLKSYQLSSVKLLVNKVRGDLLVGGESIFPEEIAEILKTPLVGVVPDEYKVSASVYEESENEVYKPHPAIKVVCNNLLLDKQKLYDCTKKYSGFIGGIRRLLKKNL